MMLRITNLTSNKLLARNARVADSFFSRLKGLLGKKRLLAGEGLLIRPCSSVHTVGMRFSIDVVFVGSGNQVVKTVPFLKPGKVAVCRGAEFVVELPAGVLEQSQTKPGDCLELE